MKIGITMGDPNGIGPEIILKSLNNLRTLLPDQQFIVYGQESVFRFYSNCCSLPWPDFKIQGGKQNIPADRQFILIDSNQSDFQTQPGVVDPAAGKLAYTAIELGISSALSGMADVLVTAPIQKESFRRAGVPYLDHTAALAGLCRAGQAQTLFVTGNLRILFLTRHLPFREIAENITREGIVAFVEIAEKELTRIGLNQPRLALAALNPHGGDNGLMGDEELHILKPAVEALKLMGVRISGPVPADAVFHLAAAGEFDVVISLYHDQGHIAAKTLDFYGTVSLTLGLPFLRTSVDHGTAFDIAGKGLANEQSMVNAIKAAVEYHPGEK